MSYDIDIYVDHQDGYTSSFEVGGWLHVHTQSFICNPKEILR
jgi:hypothetical protein